MTIEGAVIIEQGVTFAIIHVAPEVTRYTVKSTQTRRALMRFFPGMPIILMDYTPADLSYGSPLVITIPHSLL